MLYKKIMEAVSALKRAAGPATLLTSEVERFCTDHDLAESLSAALGLVSKCFDVVSDPSVRLVHDPEVGDEWVVIDAAVRGDRQQVRESYHRYLKAFVAAVAADRREKIRLFHERA